MIEAAVTSRIYFYNRTNPLIAGSRSNFSMKSLISPMNCSRAYFIYETLGSSVSNYVLYSDAALGNL